MVRVVCKLFTPGVPLSPRIHVSLIFMHRFPHYLLSNFGACCRLVVVLLSSGEPRFKLLNDRCAKHLSPSFK